MQPKYIIIIITIVLNITFAWPDDDKNPPLNLSNIQEFKDLQPQIPPVIYSGYFNISAMEKSFFYVFVTKQGSVKTDRGIPIVLWLNGGPGCSSLFGFVSQSGPFIFNEDSDTVKINEYSWHKHAHILYLDSPAGVGFSQAFTSSAYQSSDTTVAQDNYYALIAFFQEFIELATQDFYIAGENYGGVFTAKLAQLILRKNAQDPIIKINLQGILIGNGCIEKSECYSDIFSPYQVQFMYTRGFIDQSQYDSYVRKCIDLNDAGCSQIIENIENIFTKSRINIENVYDVCHPLVSKQLQQNINSQYAKDISHYLLCADKAGPQKMFNSLKNQKQFKAVEADREKPISWKLCSDKIQYTRQSYQVYSTLFNLIKTNLRIIFYSGDFNMRVPIQGSLAWLKKMRANFGLSIKRNWRAWSREDNDGNQVLCGMVWQLQGITFYSVTGAGGSAARSQPEAVEIILKKMISPNQQKEHHNEIKTDL